VVYTISIPFGAIKRVVFSVCFLPLFSFQFLLVRLKGSIYLQMDTKINHISIPFGAIKRTATRM